MEALKVIKSGAIGEVVRVEGHMGNWGKPGDWWRSSKSISGGILYDWGVHELEYILQIIRSDVKEVSGFLKQGFWAKKSAWKKDTNEDEGFINIRFKSGQWATLCITSIDANPKQGMMEITGTQGSVVFEIRNYWVYTHADNGNLITIKGPTRRSEYERYYENIADHLSRNKPLVITPEWSRRPIHILDLAHKSAKLGKALMTKYA
jgi:predicted dehydrogenase